MSEMEELKKSALQSKAQQQVDAVGAYLDALTETIEERRKKRNISNVLEWIVWLAWVVVGIVGTPELDHLFMLLFVIALCYDWMRLSLLRSAYGEFYGAVHILELLGMIPPRDGRAQRRKKRFWKMGRELAQSWAAKKKADQGAVYAPA